MKTSTTTPDLVIRDGLILPMDRDRHWVHGAIVIRNGRIDEICQDNDRDWGDARVLDADGAAVLPGFVQGHVHVVQSLLRHQADGLSLLEWLQKRTWPYEAALSGDEIEAAAELGIAELLCGGTTTALDFGTTHDHDRVFRAAEELGLRLVSGKTHMDIGEETPPALLEDRDRSLAEAEALGQRWHGAAGGLLSYAVAPRFALSCSEDMLSGCSELARRHGWLLQTHAAENIAEVGAVRELTGHANIDYLDLHGLLGEDVVLAHGIHLDASEIQRLARTRTTICHCPGANLKLGSGIADVPRLLEAGIRVALGADGPPCNNRLSVFHEMSLAGTLHNLKHGPTAIDAWKVLAMTTRDGAAALHLGDTIGTLETGKAADVAVVDLGDWSALPGGDPASRIVFGASAQMVRHVIVSGRPVVVWGELVSKDPATIRAKVKTAWGSVRAKLEAW